MKAEDFYEPSPDPGLRFGDVVQACALAAEWEDKDRQVFSIDVHASLVVVLSPSCSIRDGLLAVCPLRVLHKKYLRATKLKENPLLLNGKMLAEDAMPPQQWQALPESQKAQKRATKLAYVFASVFVFAPHDLLPVKPEKMGSEIVSIGHHEIDFRESSCLRSKKITDPDASVPSVDKRLQLSRDARQALCEKLQTYYQREIEGLESQE